MRIKREQSITEALHPDEEIYRAAARITNSFNEVEQRLKKALNDISCEKKKEILKSNLAKNGVNV